MRKRPSCRISKVIDVIRLLNPAGAQAPNYKVYERKWGLHIVMCCASVSEPVLQPDGHRCWTHARLHTSSAAVAVAQASEVEAKSKCRPFWNTHITIWIVLFNGVLDMALWNSVGITVRCLQTLARMEFVRCVLPAAHVKSQRHSVVLKMDLLQQWRLQGAFGLFSNCHWAKVGCYYKQVSLSSIQRKKISRRS